ncbi:MAG: ribonuclease P protein subunit [Candidatus Lokiarchaeota archaeon]|nr:ribonuclease P protein subunit [Candidatus Lokiarchaeota archaeon]
MKLKLKLRNFVQDELIGINVTVVESKDPNLVGIEGKIIDETQNMLIIETENSKIKNIVKEITKFKFKISEQKSVIVNGKIIKGRPEDRIKKFLKI